MKAAGLNADQKGKTYMEGAARNGAVGKGS